MHLSRGTLRAYIANELDTAEMRLSAMHLQMCNRCASKMKEIENQVQFLAPLLESAGEACDYSKSELAFARQRLNDRITADGPRALRFGISQQVWPRWAWISVVLITAVVGLLAVPRVRGTIRNMATSVLRRVITSDRTVTQMQSSRSEPRPNITVQTPGRSDATDFNQPNASGAPSSASAQQPTGLLPRGVSEEDYARSALHYPHQSSQRSASEKSNESEQALQSILFRVTEAETGRPIVGASLNQDKVTGSDGSCSFPIVFPANVWVRAEGYAPRVASFRRYEPYPKEYTFLLKRGVTIGGYVRDEKGTGIPNATVFVVGGGINVLEREHSGIQGDKYFVTTNSAGYWVSHEIPPDLDPITIRVLHPEFQPAYFATDSSVNRLDPRAIWHEILADDLKSSKCLLILKRGVVVSGNVVDKAGNPIGGATIWQAGDFGRATVLAATGTDGRFSFSNGIPGRAVIHVEASGFAPTSESVEIEPTGAPIVFQLLPGHIVSGRILDQAGEPVPDAEIALDSLRSGTTVQWNSRVNQQGRFRWDSAPARTLIYRVTARGFLPATQVVLEPDKDHEIKIQSERGVVVVGRVVDASTRFPIQVFRVSTSSNRLPDGWHNYSWGAEGRNGEFSLTLSNMRPEYSVRIEADGYLTDSSRIIQVSGGHRKLEYALTRVAPIPAVVLLPNGEVAAGAEVILLTGPESQPVVMSGPDRLDAPEEVIARLKADASGRLSVPLAGVHTIVVSHAAGLAKVSSAELSASSRIVLIPWGGIEGTLLIGPNRAAGQAVSLTSLIPAATPKGLVLHFETSTDANGHFSFKRVPPGEHRLTRILNPLGGAPGTRALHTQTTPVIVREGETTSVRMGGVGRPVIGRVVVEGAAGPVNWGQNYATFELKLSAMSAPDRKDSAAHAAWLRAFFETEEGRNRLRSQRHYDFEIAADGSFRIEDVPSGTYVLTLRLMGLPPNYDPTRPNSIFGNRPELGTFTTEVSVLEKRGDRSDQPQNIGTVTLKLNTRR